MPAVIPAAGFALFLLTDILSFHATTAFSGVGLFGSALESAYFVTLAGSRIAAYAIIAIARSRSHQEGLPSRATALAATIASFAGAGLIAASLCLDSTSSTLISLIIGAALFGSSQGIMSLIWLTTLTSLSYRSSYLFLIASHGGATILCALVLLLPSKLLLPTTLAALAVANVCAARIPRPTESACTFGDQARNIAPFLWKGILAVGVFAFVSGFVSAIARHGTAEANPVGMQYFVLGVSCVVLIVMAVPALALRQPLKLEISYRIALPLSALGFLVLPGLIESIPTSVAGVLATTGYMITGIVLYCTVAEIAKTAGIPSLPLLASSTCLTLLSLLAGTGTGLALAPSLTHAGTGVALVGLGSLYLVTLAAAWLIGRSNEPNRTKRRRKQSKPNASSAEPQETIPKIQGATPAPPASRRVSEHPFANTPEIDRLPDQERAILHMLIEGRTIPRIAQELFLSESAVKYHVQKLYRRFDVHSRSELNEAIGRLSHTHPTGPVAEETLAREHDLTAREKDILVLIARGATVAETAQKLTISENTVKTHVKRVYGKLGVHSKQEVIDMVNAD